MYYIITDLNGIYELLYQSAKQIIDAADHALLKRGSCLERYAGIDYIVDSDGDITLERDLGDSEALTAAKRYFQDGGRFDIYCESDTGEFLWHAEEIGLIDQAKALVALHDPEYAATEF